MLIFEVVHVQCSATESNENKGWILFHYYVWLMILTSLQMSPNIRTYAWD